MILIGEEWAIDAADSRNITLLKKYEKKETNTEEDEEAETHGWRVEGYYPSLASALRGMLNKGIMYPESIAQLSARIDALEDAIDAVLKEYTGRGLEL